MKKIKFAILGAIIFFACVGVFIYSLYSRYWIVEEVSFNSHGVMLSGTLVIPKKKAVVASIVFVSGSGKSERSVGLAKYLASDGIATLVYDKRGVGKSGGVYVGVEGNVSEDNLRLLSDDAVAAIEFINRYPKLSNIPAGLIGVSQAGWIVPLAAAKTNSIRFIGLWSGPVCKVSEEGIYSRFTGDGDAVDKATDFQKIKQAMKGKYIWPKAFGSDIDPVDSLVSLSIPGFWVFGEKDASIPVDLSISRLEELIHQGKSNYRYTVVKGLGHLTVDPTLPMMTGWIKDVSSAANMP